MSAYDIPRHEHPRPTIQRQCWINLNGRWEFEDDPGDSGLERGILSRALRQSIIVPFCRESRLSGIHDTDRMLAVWYRREITVPAEWTGLMPVLHIQAADYDTTVWVNGMEVGRHRGGFTPIDLPLYNAKAGDRLCIVVRCRDDWSRHQPRGKQSQIYKSQSCLYTRTTGIWQTVWLEGVPPAHLLRPRVWPDVANLRYRCILPVSPCSEGMIVEAALRRDSRTIAEGFVMVGPDLTPCLDLVIPDHDVLLWRPEHPHLDDLFISLLRPSGDVVDHVRSHAGMRACGISGKALTLNGRPRFQRLVLDQGYYADGVMTAPTDEDLVRDIRLGLQAGFNGARLHQKVFEERFLWHADRMGWMVWGEFADWGQGQCQPEDHGLVLGGDQWGSTFVGQWLEAVERDQSHPSIVGWIPVNETWPGRRERIDTLEDATMAMYRATKLADPTRPVIDASGWSHRVEGADVWDSHDYDQDPATFAQRHADPVRPYSHAWNGSPGTSGNVPYRGQPVLVSEFGGARWDPRPPEHGESWGYGSDPKDEQEFLSRFAGLCRALLENPAIAGYCYTQLTDVEQERNGLFRYDRSCKVDPALLARAQGIQAAIESSSM